MNSLITLLIILFFIYFLNKNSIGKTSKASFLTAFVIKLLSTIGVWYTYTYYYSETFLNDIHKYFNDGFLLNQSFKTAPIQTLNFIFTHENSLEISNFTDKLLFWTKPNQYGLLNDNQTIILINFLFSFITNDSLLLQSLLISTLSFYATYKLYQNLKTHFNIPTKLTFILLFFNPSYLIWTSGNFKETFIYIGITLLFANLIKISEKKITIKSHILIFINLLFIMFCKNYFLLFLLPGIIGFYIRNLILKKSSFKPIKIAYITFFISIIGASLFYHPVNFDNTIKDPIKRKLYIKKLNIQSYQENALGNSRNIIEILRLKQGDQLTEARRQRAKTQIYIPRLDDNLRSFLTCIPFSIFNTLFRPNIIDIKKFELVPDAIFSLFIIFIIGASIFWRKKIEQENQRQITIIIIYFSFTSFIIIGMLVPVLGNLVRYRAPILPLFAIAIISMIDFNKIPFWNKS